MRVREGEKEGMPAACIMNICYVAAMSPRVLLGGDGNLLPAQRSSHDGRPAKLLPRPNQSTLVSGRGGPAAPGPRRPRPQITPSQERERERERERKREREKEREGEGERER